MIQLKWGGNAHPDNATAAWGARMIARGFERIDMLHDRQDCAGPEVATLLGRLNDGLLERAKVLIDELRLDYWASVDYDPTVPSWSQLMRPDEAEPFVLVMEDGVTIVADTNASHGYCYVTAWLEPASDTCVVHLVGNEDLEHNCAEHQVVGRHKDGTPTSEPCSIDCTDCVV